MIGCPSGRSGPLLASEFLGGWVPGALGNDPYPRGTGVPLFPGMRLILQIHYNTAGRKPKLDRTKLQLELADHVEEPGVMMAIFDPRWTQGTTFFRIPPRRRFTYSYTFDLAPLFELFEPETVRAHLSGVHMHYLGKSGRLILNSVGGRKTILLDVPQEQLQLAAPVLVRPAARPTCRRLVDGRVHV